MYEGTRGTLAAVVWLGTADWVQVKHRWGTEVDTEGYDEHVARAVQWLQ